MQCTDLIHFTVRTAQSITEIAIALIGSRHWFRKWIRFCVHEIYANSQRATVVMPISCWSTLEFGYRSIGVLLNCGAAGRGMAIWNLANFKKMLLISCARWTTSSWLVHLILNVDDGNGDSGGYNESFALPCILNCFDRSSGVCMCRLPPHSVLNVDWVSEMHNSSAAQQHSNERRVPNRVLVGRLTRD